MFKYRWKSQEQLKKLYQIGVHGTNEKFTFEPFYHIFRTQLICTKLWQNSSWEEFMSRITMDEKNKNRDRSWILTFNYTLVNKTNKAVISIKGALRMEGIFWHPTYFPIPVLLFNITHARHKNVKISHYFKKTLEQFLMMFIARDTWLTVMIVEGHLNNRIQE